MGVSNNITTVLNFIALLASIPTIGAGVWLASKPDNECIHNFRWHVLVLGLLVLLVLCCMAVLIALLLFLFVFAFIVTRPDGTYHVPGRAFKESTLDGFYPWLRNHVAASMSWSNIRTCLADSEHVCIKLTQDYVSTDQFFNSRISPLQEGHIDLLSSDHSPTVPELKLLEDGDFLKAWGGISSLQGTIAVGKHADIVVWQPEREFDLNDHYPVFLKHPSLSAYMGRRLSGKVLDTFVRGNLVFKKGKHAPAACGVPILAK